VLRRVLIFSFVFLAVVLLLDNCCKKYPKLCESSPKKDDSNNPNQTVLYGKGSLYVKNPAQDPYQCNINGCDIRNSDVVFVRGTDWPFPFLKGFRRLDGSLLYISRNFKDYRESLHWGIDMPVVEGTPVYSTTDGTAQIFDAGEKVGCGKFVLVEDRGHYVYYCHLSSWGVLNGDKVYTGQFIGLSGNTGNSSAPHVHYSRCPLFSGDKYTLYSFCYCPIECGEWNQ
jgi:murein DD-endopeptidase MepM/ murein hydrolase activator NlpD